MILMIPPNRKGLSVTDNIPIPDPTARTLDTVHREVESLKDTIDIAMDYRGQLFQEQFEALHDKLNLAEEYRQEREATAESHRIELKADNQRTVETAMTAAEKAVQAALAAAEKARDQQTIATNLANSKSETAMAKALDQITATFTAAIANALTQINNVKEIATGSEKFRLGGVDKNTEHRLNSGLLTAVIAVGVTVVSSMIVTGVALYFGLHK